MRLEIQGLRAVAISFVLLYHLWDSTFTSGFLGVDIFFVISSYLMAILLSKKCPLNASTIIDFYYRRIKRIVPLFLFIVFCTLICGIFLLAPAEFPNLSMDAIVSSTFTSNILNIHDNGYFDLYAEVAFFKHTWSLACELQFYLIVPFIFLTFGWLDKYHGALKFALIGTIFVISFVLQIVSSIDVGHMQLQNRFWQFMMGFLAFYINRSQALGLTCLYERIEDIKDEKKSGLLFSWKFIKNVFLAKRKAIVDILDEVINLVILSLLIFFVSVDLTQIRPVNRLIVTILTTILLSKTTASVCLSLDWMVLIGDISYSIYLIHWPLFTLHRYWFVESYVDRSSHPTLINGIQLILCAFVAAYLVEKLYKYIGQLITSWISLYFVLILSYSFFVACIFYVCRMSPTFSYDNYMTFDEQTEARSHIQQFYITRNNNSIEYSREEVTHSNLEIHVFSQRFYACQNSTRYISTNYNANLNSMSWFCHDKGMGNKNVVIIGNSHGRELWYGVKQNFQNVYKSLTLFVRDYCMPFLSKYASSDMRRVCEENERQLLPILASWSEPIDIIIIGLEYFNFLNPPLTEPIEKDEYMNALQNFFTSLENIAKEVVFIPRMHMDWEIEPYAQILQKQLHFGLDLNLFQQSLQNHKDYLSNVQKRIDMVKCAKCVKVEWANAWCSSNEVCRALDNKNLTQFRDSKHISSYGSLLYGKMLYELYNQYLINKI